MPTRTLLLLIVKVLGLFLLKDLLPMIPQILSLVSMTVTYTDSAWSPMLAGVFSVAIYGYFSYVLLFRTEWVIAILQLEKGLETELPLNVHRSTVLRIAIIMIGGLMVTNTAPTLLHQLFLFTQYLNTRNSAVNFRAKPDATYLVFLVAQIVIGLLLLGYHSRLVAYIELRQRNG